MSTQIFPTPSALPGIDISISRKVAWDTITQQAVSGKETRVARRIYPIREFGLKFNFLRSSTIWLELQQLEGFFNARQGMYDSFLWTDPDDNAVLAQGLGQGNGVATLFQLVRPFGGFAEPIYAPNTVTNVYFDSTAQSSTTYTVNQWGSTIAPGTLSFAIAPSTQVVTADFTYYWPVRFTIDDLSFDRFVNLIYDNKALSFRTIL